MCGHDKSIILIVDDDKSMREEIRDFFRDKYPHYKCLLAGHIDEAKGIMLQFSHNISLIVLDMILPRTAECATNIKRLSKKRGFAYDSWQALSDRNDKECHLDLRKAQFAVDMLDRQIYELLDVEGGTNLLKTYINESNPGGKFDKPILFLTARENKKVRERALKLAVEGKAQWLVKPWLPQALASAVERLLENHV